VSWSTKAITALGWTRHSITQTLANPAAGFRIAVNGDAVYAWGAQVEAASFLSSYIPTTIAAATRAADSLSYAAAGHLSVLQPYSIYGEATPTQVAQTATLVASNVNYAPMFRSVGFSPGYPDFYSDNGVNFAIAQNAVVPGVTSKIAATMDGTNVLIAHAGIAGTWMARGSLTAEPTALYIGRQPAQGWEAYGNIRNVKTYPYALTPEQMLEMTAATVVEAAPTEPYDMTTFYPAPPKASAVMLRVAVVRALGFAANFAGSLAVASIGFPATAQAVFLITKNGTTIGTITFAAGAIVGVFASVGGLAQTLAVTDILAIIAPATPDATLSEIGFTLAATRAAALAA
jgi:hypothetical protein